MQNISSPRTPQRGCRSQDASPRTPSNAMPELFREGFFHRLEELEHLLHQRSEVTRKQQALQDELQHSHKELNQIQRQLIGSSLRLNRESLKDSETQDKPPRHWHHLNQSIPRVDLKKPTMKPSKPQVQKPGPAKAFTRKTPLSLMIPNWEWKQTAQTGKRNDKSLATQSAESLATQVSRALTQEELQFLAEVKAYEGYEKAADITTDLMAKELCSYEQVMLDDKKDHKTAEKKFQVLSKLRATYNDIQQLSSKLFEGQSLCGLNRSILQRKMNRIEIAQNKYWKLKEELNLSFVNLDRFDIAAELAPLREIAKRRATYEAEIAKAQEELLTCPTNKQGLANGRLNNLEACLKNLNSESLSLGMSNRLKGKPIASFIEEQEAISFIQNPNSVNFPQRVLKQTVKAAHEGFLPAQAILYSKYVQQSTSYRDKTLWEQEVLSQARGGHPDAAAALGEMVLKGKDVCPMEEVGEILLAATAAHNHAQARYVMAGICLHLGFEIDNKELLDRGEKLLLAGAAKQHIQSLGALSRFYQQLMDKTGQEDHAIRIKYWLLQDALSGTEEATTKLASLYVKSGNIHFAQNILRLCEASGREDEIKLNLAFECLKDPQHMESFLEISESFLILKKNAQGEPDALGYFDRLESFVNRLAYEVSQMEITPDDRKALIGFLVKQTKLVGETSLLLTTQLRSLISFLLNG